MFTRRWATPTTRKSLAAATVAGLVLSLSSLAVPAQAATQEVTGAELTWGLNLETGAGAFQPGACNFLSAGKAGDTGSSRAWTENDGFHKSSEGNVKIIKDGPDGTSIAPTWANKCQTGAGSSVGPTGTKNVSNNKVVLSNGVGTADIAAKTARIEWSGSFTSAFYSGLTYWSASNPVLTVKSDGTATLTATASGYGADMNDTSAWTTIAPETVTLANMTGVTVDADGFVKVPEYFGVSTPAGVDQSGTIFGAFPEDFVTFQGKTGTQAYWHSTGGAADVRKPATEVAVAWSLNDVKPPVENGKSENIDVAVKVPETVVVPEPEVFSLTVGDTNASMSTATQLPGGSFSATGALPTAIVKDTRKISSGWSLTGKASAFTASAGTFTGSALGWDPTVSNPAGTIAEGAVVAAGNPGLETTQILASTVEKNTAATIDTALELVAPAGTKAGTYTSRVTLTLVSE